MMGIREFESKHNPTPYYNRDKQGNHIKREDIAENAAEYLSTQQSGLPEPEPNPQPTNWNDDPMESVRNEAYDTTAPTTDELREGIKKLTDEKSLVQTKSQQKSLKK